MKFISLFYHYFIQNQMFLNDHQSSCFSPVKKRSKNLSFLQNFPPSHSNLPSSKPQSSQDQQFLNLSSPIRQDRIKNLIINLDSEERKHRNRILIIKKKKSLSKSSLPIYSVQQKIGDLSSKIDDFVRSKNKFFGLNYFSPETQRKNTERTPWKNLMQTIQNQGKLKYLSVKNIKNIKHDKKIKIHTQIKQKNMIKVSSKSINPSQNVKEWKNRQKRLKKFPIVRQNPQKISAQKVRGSDDGGDLCGWHEKDEQINDLLFQAKN